MQLARFVELIAPITSHIERRALNPSLERELNGRFAVAGPEIRAIFEFCREAIAAGWMCNREAGGIRYGRVIKPGPETHDFSVDVVEMASLVGPHHSHPNGEIDLIMPLTATARFDDRGAGWLVYGPGSAHCPTVTAGKALILYLLPSGAIEFTRT